MKAAPGAATKHWQHCQEQQQQQYTAKKIKELPTFEAFEYSSTFMFPISLIYRYNFSKLQFLYI